MKIPSIRSLINLVEGVTIVSHDYFTKTRKSIEIKRFKYDNDDEDGAFYHLDDYLVEIEAYIDNNFAGSGLLNFDEGYFESISIKDQYRRQYAKQYAPKTGNVMKVKLHIKKPVLRSSIKN